MHFALDHLFICSAPGAPEADRLVQFGMREGPANQHPGQGTANRQYFLVFLAVPKKKAGFQRVRIETELPNSEILSPDNVWVEAAK
jgi:hypothetical protein